MKRILVIGGVAAGATAAARVRRLDATAEITILEAGADVSFANCGLPYYIGGEIQHRSSLLLASPETFDDQYRIRVYTHTIADSIDRQERRVTVRNTRTGEQQDFSYDALILAQGGKPIVPPLPGVEQENVFQLWTLSDMDAIQRYIGEHQPSSAVVVGGGFIGLEMVEALAQRGLKVSLVEMAPHVMPNLVAEMAGFLTRELQDHGVELYLERSLQAIEGDTAILSDGTRVPAGMILLSVGVKPTLELARAAGLETGEAGGLVVNSQLQTTDPHIYAAGDMAEIEHRVLGRPVRVPLAGPANRQGRIAAENALGGTREYRGALGTSIVKLFGAVAGSTGLSVQAAAAAGIAAEAVTVHKTSHTAYYPGAEKVSLQLIFEAETGRILGGQAAGRVGVDKRLDVVATAIAGGLTLEDLAELDLAYAPPFNSPNGPVNMAAFTAGNHHSGFSPVVRADQFEEFVSRHEPVVVDLRDPISYRRASLAGSVNLSHNQLRERMDELPPEQTVVVISDDGQKGHVALRMLAGAGHTRVYNLSGGYISLERHARAAGFRQLQVGLLPIEPVRAGAAGAAGGSGVHAAEGHSASAAGTGSPDQNAAAQDGPLVVDVRTAMEFQMGAYPGARHIELDEIHERVDELGGSERHIVLYCASGARSAYGVRILQSLGFTRVENGGGLHDMMTREY
ncbi:FAD-dependent oxidoreductase [Spirochaeta africana]|uniref:NAD(FAD)-dependent dehydrogenase n=1 Tax=Spirochaeta africana (strain ATCC 700263 / DSM 8902 / Z-7692) TaxID=889378 RepID=H9UH24_SPIAZ|nr:FAD-dependent oxidoreductase [Spirochaeta africana]AFG36817.1 NAD(FAD)-dependent dehydrogenase [Spirochaeta africana DSM 8902]